MKWYIIIFLGAVILILLIVILGIVVLRNGSGGSTGNVSCTYDGTVYENGTSFDSTDGCNTCSCNNGQVACTEMACVGITGTPAVTVAPTATGIVSPTINITALPTVTPIAGGLNVYFGRPTDITDYTTIQHVQRVTAETGLTQVSVVLNAILAGPNASEKTLEFVPIMRLSGDSTCSGKSYQFSLSAGKLTVRFCKEILYIANPGTEGSYAGMGIAANSRIINALTESLKINGITTVIIRNSDNSCFAPDTGLNTSCL